MSSFCGNSTFWDTGYLLNSSWPRFTQCFQTTFLVYAPASFLCLSCLIYVPYLLRLDTSMAASHTRLTLAKTILAFLLVVVNATIAITDVLVPVTWTVLPDIDQYDTTTTAMFVSHIVDIFSFIFTILVVHLEKRSAVITSGVLFTYWLLVITCETVPLYTFIQLQVYRRDVLNFVALLSRLALASALFVVTCFSDLQLHLSNRFTLGNECPEVTASFPSKLTFAWITRLLVTGFKRTLTAEDLWRLNPRDTSERAASQFFWAWKYFNKRKENHKLGTRDITTGKFTNVNGDARDFPYQNGHTNGHANGHTPSERTPLLGGRKQDSSGKDVVEDSEQVPVNRRSRCSLFLVLVKAFGGHVLVSYACKFVSDLLQLLGPLLLRSLILHIENKEENPTWHGYLLAAGMLVTSWLQTIFYHQHYHLAMTSGMRMKSALLTAIYKKALCLDTSGQRSSPTGEIVNLMSVDCQRVQDLMSYTWMFWSIPLQISLALYLLWNTIGLPVLSGLVLLLLLVPFNTGIAYLQQKLQKQNLSWKDRRIKIMNDVLGGIKVLKLYAWEESFQRKILAVRGKELSILTKLAWLNAVNVSIWTCAPFMVCLVSFVTHVIAYPDVILTAEIAFVTVALFNILQFPISFIPELVSFTTQAKVSLSRIGRFLCETELDRSHYQRHDMSDCAIRIEKGVFTWNPDANFRLSGINLAIPRGSFVAVVGPVGSGKSSLLSAILGEMDSLQGKVHVSGSTAYVPQASWIQNCSLRDNILFGYSFNLRRYQKIIDACALVPDLQILPGGDQTEIGEKGVNLSGGQKQRVSIARALYANADTYILDDPLSAVDSHVGKHIFKRILSDKGMLKNKTRIMATNAIHCLPLVDLIVVMQDGRVSEFGSYMQLMKQAGNFSHFLLTNFRQLQESESEIDEDEEVLEMRKKIWEHLEAVTSQSEGNTSGEEPVRFQLPRLDSVSSKELSPSSPSPLALTDVQQKKGLVKLESVLAGEEKKRDTARLTESEVMETGTVKLTVLGAYFKNIGYFFVVAAFLMFTMYQVANVLASIWLSKWTGDLDLKSANISSDRLKQNKYILVYGTLGIGQILFIFIFACVAALRMVTAASSMHASMLDRVLKAPMSFFDTTPMGRILNRFSRDVETLDNQLPQIVFMWFTCVFSVLATLLVISINTPIFTSVIFPLFLAYLAMQRFFVPTSRQLKRLEAVTRSPIYSHFTETLLGCHVIRAFDSVAKFVQTSSELVDKNQVFYFAGITSNRWLGVWVEVIGSLVVFFSAIFCLVTPGVDGAVLGLSVSYALQITQALKWLVRTMSDIETNVVSVERVQEYTQLPQEAPRITDVRSPVTWPGQGQIVFRQFSTRYREGLELVLKGLDCVIQAGEKIGIVGRTGAGKSSMAMSLFRLLEATEGEIIIDNLSISLIGLYELRAKLTILPQDPVIFSGTLRENLDPSNDFLDQEIWTALSLSNMKNVVSDMPAGLYTEVGEDGFSLSSGQKQLLCLTRALLRRSKILVLDEPTSCVDLETDAIVQATVRRVFKHCTTITVAHRISTILDCNRVMVLDGGSIVEFDNPRILLTQERSLFYKLARSDGVV